MVVIVWIACTKLKNEFANSLVKMCYTNVVSLCWKSWKKVHFLKLVKSNSLTTVGKI